MGYYNTCICALVPGSSRRILEIGCSDGSLGVAIKSREELKHSFIAGIELLPGPAELAEKVLDEVHAADAETFDYRVFGNLLMFLSLQIHWST
jgi:hypothetical protein